MARFELQMYVNSLPVKTNREHAARWNQGKAARGNCNSPLAERRIDITGQGYLRQGTTGVKKKGSGSQSL